MKLNTPAATIRPIDVLFMVPVGLATGIAFCYAFGQIATWEWLLAAGAYQLAYLWWVSARFPRARRAGVKFALKIQLQAASQIASLFFYIFSSPF